MVAVPDEEILDAITITARLGGVFGEPAGVAGVAGLRKAVRTGIIRHDESVLVVITGNGLKDIDTARKAAGEPISIVPEIAWLEKSLAKRGFPLTENDIPMSTLLKNCFLLTLDPPSAGKGDLRIEGGAIAASGESLTVLEGDEVVDLEGKIVIPGMVCAHTHLYSSLARGMDRPKRRPKNFLEILRRIWWKLDRALDDESVYYSAVAGALDSVKMRDDASPRPSLFPRGDRGVTRHHQTGSRRRRSPRRPLLRSDRPRGEEGTGCRPRWRIRGSLPLPRDDGSFRGLVGRARFSHARADVA